MDVSYDTKSGASRSDLGFFGDFVKLGNKTMVL